VSNISLCNNRLRWRVEYQKKLTNIPTCNEASKEEINKQKKLLRKPANKLRVSNRHVVHRCKRTGLSLVSLSLPRCGRASKGNLQGSIVYTVQCTRTVHSCSYIRLRMTWTVRIVVVVWTIYISASHFSPLWCLRCHKDDQVSQSGEAKLGRQNSETTEPIDKYFDWHY